VFWGWGQSGAFSTSKTGPTGAPRTGPSNDPDRVGARMTSFVKALGGTNWAGVQTQYFQQTGGQTQHITNPRHQEFGVWWDNQNRIHNNLAWIELAREAQRAVAHFGVNNLNNSQFVIATPQNYNDASFNNGAGYCAWHDYTIPDDYPGVKPHISFTNMPYVVNLGFSCGQDAVNPAPGGDLDGVTIVTGHEIEETVTDPGAETVDPNPTPNTGNIAGTGITINSSEGNHLAVQNAGTNLGGWFDYSGYENGDKCAWVGNEFSGSGVPPSTSPGGMNNIKGNDGRLYPVQSLWSNQAAGGAGYCAGAGDDLPF
jgi:serine protease